MRLCSWPPAQLFPCIYRSPVWNRRPILLMKKSGDIPGDLSSTDPSAIEAVIARLEAGQLSQADARLISRLLRLLLKLLEVVQYKNTSLKRLKRMLFGSSSDKRIPQATEKQEKERALQSLLQSQQIEVMLGET